MFIYKVVTLYASMAVLTADVFMTFHDRVNNKHPLDRSSALTYFSTIKLKIKFLASKSMQI